MLWQDIWRFLCAMCIRIYCTEDDHSALRIILFVTSQVKTFMALCMVQRSCCCPYVWKNNASKVWKMQNFVFFLQLLEYLRNLDFILFVINSINLESEKRATCCLFWMHGSMKTQKLQNESECKGTSGCEKHKNTKVKVKKGRPPSEGCCQLFGVGNIRETWIW